MRESDASALSPLVDAFGRTHTYLRLSVTDRCNLRCVYCMPKDGVARRQREEILRFDEILRVVHFLVRAGIRKVRLTGGEPLVRKGIVTLIQALVQIPGLQCVGMTTNGVLLASYAQALKSAGVKALNVSVDTLRSERFERITLRQHFEDLRAGLVAALAAGFSSLKINTVVMGGINDDELLDFVELAREHPVQIRFIEYMPFRGNGWGRAELVPWRTMRAAIETRHVLVPVDTDCDSVCRVHKIEGFAGSIGFIAPVTDHFCAGCNRLRLAADGTLRTCLFGPAQVNLRSALRGGATDSEMDALIRAAVAAKPRQHPPLTLPESVVDQSMVEIGG